MVDIIDPASENFDIYGESKDGIVTYCLKIGKTTLGGYKTEERAEKDRDRFFVFMVAEAKKVLTKWNEVIDFEEDDDVAAIANEIIGQVSNKELSEAMASEKFDNQIIEVADIFAL